MFPLLVLGCSFGLAPSSGNQNAGAPSIDAVDPATGSSRGGTTVTITGSGFTDGVTVGFGGVWGDVTVLDSNTLAVETPGIGVELTVDVTVETSGGVATLADGFSFRGVDRDTGDDTGDNGDKVGGYVIFESSELACPSCYGLSTTGPTVTASARFHAPKTGSWLSWLPAEGACASVTPNVLATASLDAGTNVVLNDGVADVLLYANGSGTSVVYTSTGLTESSYVEGGNWDIAARGGSGADAVSAFLLTDALLTPVGFTDIQPSSLLTSSSSSAFTTAFGVAGGTSITWSPIRGGDFVLVTLDATRDGTSVGTTTCRSADDGSFVVPPAAVAAFTSGDLLAVTISRYAVDEGVLSDGSAVETMGIIEHVGTGVVQ